MHTGFCFSPFSHCPPPHPPGGFVSQTLECAIWVWIDSHCMLRLRLSGEISLLLPLFIKNSSLPISSIYVLDSIYTFRYYLAKLFIGFFFLSPTRRWVPWRQNSSYLHSTTPCLANGSHSTGNRSLKPVFVRCSYILIEMRVKVPTSWSYCKIKCDDVCKALSTVFGTLVISLHQWQLVRGTGHVLGP